jgi:asparagine synthase (glutamine-hydrolysing)
MFAFSVWDRKTKTMTLARDRYGIKPLYYATQNDTLYFGSETKSILVHPAFRPTLDKAALFEYFTFQNFLSNNTLYQGIYMLPAGSFIELRSDNPSARPIQYWDFNFHEPETACDTREYAEELRRLMVQAVNRQLVADVELGSYLSGGIDSGTITALAARQLPYISTFTVGFDMTSASGLELALDERLEAERMSYLFRTEHSEIVLKAGDMERCIPDLVNHMEEPRVGQSYPNWYAAKLASRFVKVVLAGTGGDEIFGGYPWRYYRAVSSEDFEQFLEKYFVFWNRLIPGDSLPQAFAPIWNEIKDVSTRDIMRNVFRSPPKRVARPQDYVNYCLYFEAKTFLHGLLVVEDKLSMAHSLECRVPFLDNDLVDFAQRVPASLKLRQLTEFISVNENDPTKRQKHVQKTNDGKLLLRKAMTQYIPEEVVTREKQGFSAPDASWFKGESIEYVKTRILSSQSPIYEYMEHDTVSTLVAEHLNGTTNRRLFIWSLLVFDEWLRQFA